MHYFMHGGAKLLWVPWHMVLDPYNSLKRTFLIFLNFIYCWLHDVFVAACGLSLVVVSGSYSLDAVHGFLTGVVSLVA